ncbi:uncharacterized protein SPSK_10104 [Sporothrix schenckii 1099-18]|uniref:Uncharacterized protein n=2 Tax=Sporothrix schenckii TaxID=29908 RepID=U7Q7X7_SPOS1|nr:uncharacterized protein SPSK_10104 [Sporothrix schenckii 1099-18]ERT03332.1 hypothetical protein HMPREF1624_01643 [Sporothrix schenckii ATCC 58251]KJR84230.1 hypothetical protein SPSK_10104 [Sporothrix schenckii 1099-18]
MSGLTDEAVLEGHDLIDGAEHEALADPKDFKKVHSVGETGGSILPDVDSAASRSAKPAEARKGTESLGSKLNELKDKVAKD